MLSKGVLTIEIVLSDFIIPACFSTAVKVLLSNRGHYDHATEK